MTADITLAHPALQQHWATLKPAVLRELGLRVELDETARSRTEQAALYAVGRGGPTDHRAHVTNARPGESPHNDTPSSAYDLHVLDAQGRPTWAHPADYLAVAQISRRLGAEAGAFWTDFPDLPHVQLPGWHVGSSFPLSFRFPELNPPGGPVDLTPQLLQRIRPGLDLDTASKSAQALTHAAMKFGISTPQRLAHWLAQLAQESGFRPVSENLSGYTAAGLLRTWPSHFTAETAAASVGHPDQIADRAYGGRVGNTQPGDGWLYRGRGAVQLTGRANYQHYGVSVGFDLVGQPDLVMQFGVGGLVAGAFWAEHGCNALADRGGAAQVTAITLAVNGGLNGLPQRLAYYRVAAAQLGLPG